MVHRNNKIKTNKSDETMLSSLAQLTSIKLSFCVPTGERGRGGGGGEREREN